MSDPLQGMSLHPDLEYVEIVVAAAIEDQVLIIEKQISYYVCMLLCMCINQGPS